MAANQNKLEEFMAGVMRRNPVSPGSIRRCGKSQRRSFLHASCVEYGEMNGRVDYIRGANIASFVKLGDATMAYGVM